MNDKYEEWLTLKVKVSWDLVIYHKRTLGGEDIIEEKLIASYKTYKECLEKYKEEKGK